MGKGGLANGKGHDERGKDETLDKQSCAEFRPGDITWIKLRGTSWWPAQIVDGSAVSDSMKPRKGKSGEVLVRLYGTYKHLYVDPVTSLLEFTNVLKRNNSTQKEVFRKALDKDLSELQSGRTNTRKAKAKDNGSEYKEKPASIKRGLEDPDEDTPYKPEGSARRLKVMQDLGLTAPSGSPFLKNGQVLLCNHCGNPGPYSQSPCFWQAILCLYGLALHIDDSLEVYDRRNLEKFSGTFDEPGADWSWLF